MIVKKFFASTSRQVLQQIRQELGPDAMILSNRAVANGIEILAVAPEDLSPQNLAKQVDAPPSQCKEPPIQCKAQAISPVPLVAVANEPANAINLVQEIRSMRSLIEQQMVYQAWDTAQQRTPGKARILRDMLRAGFSAALVRQFLEKMPPGLSEQQSLSWIKAALDRNLITIPEADEMVERGGVYALVGPTGVGKTTTVAKIAARGVVRYGADKVALLSTDSYRIGAHEQLRIYGKLLGVRVIAVKDESDLQFVLEDLRQKHLVLIDTVGMSQRDQMLTEQHALLSASGTAVKRLLMLNSTGNGETLDDVVKLYRGNGLHGCILTKTDESVGIATVLDVAIRQKLPVHYVTDGQRVPEDLHLPDREELLQRAMHPVSAPSFHHLDASECQIILASAPSCRPIEEASLG